MGIVERREREREEVRRKILDAARSLFMREGYDRVTMRGIAEAIEYSPTAIYHHFKDKDDLVNALCEEDFTKLLGAFDARQISPDPVENVRRFGHAYARFGLDNPNHYRFMFMTAPEGHLKKQGSGEHAFLLFEQAVVAAIEAGRFQKREPRLVARSLWSTIHGAVSLLITLAPELWPGGPVSPDLVDEVIENGIRGYLAPSPVR